MTNDEARMTNQIRNPNAENYVRKTCAFRMGIQMEISGAWPDSLSRNWRFLLFISYLDRIARSYAYPTIPELGDFVNPCRPEVRRWRKVR
jgi:hypothetical protein